MSCNLYQRNFSDEEELPYRAGDLGRFVEHKVRRRLHTSDIGHLNLVWKSSIEVVNAGFAQGSLLFDPCFVMEAVEMLHWIPMPRFPVSPGEKVRLVDDASALGSSANLFSRMTEKLSEPSADYLMAVVGSLATRYPAQIGGWNVDGTWTSLTLSDSSQCTQVMEGCPSSHFRSQKQEDLATS